MLTQDELFASRKERFEEWKNWVVKNKKFPRPNARGKKERALAFQMQNLLNAFRKDQRYLPMIHEYHELKKLFPYADNVRKKRDKKTNMDEIISWSKEHGRLPKQNSKSEEERRLAYRCHLLLASLKKEPDINRDLLNAYEELKELLKK